MTTDADDGEYDEDGNLDRRRHASGGCTGRRIDWSVRLARATEMDRKPAAKRRELLRDQVDTLERLHLEAAGQMTLQFDKPKPVASTLLNDEAQALIVAKGLAIANALRRKA